MSSEKPRKYSRHFPHLADELREPNRHGEGLALPAVEDYAKAGVFEVHVRYCIRGLGNERRYYCIVMNTLLDHQLSGDLDGFVTCAGWGADLAFLDHREAIHEKAMLVSYVRFVQEAEGSIAIPAGMVRLHALQDCRSLVADELLDVLFSEDDGTPADRESRVPCFGGLHSTVVPHNERPEEVIQGATGVVDAIADHESPIGHRGLSMQLEPEDVQPAFGVHFLR